MKDRLIELIDGFDLQTIPNSSREWMEQFADHLIANGVIVLPCKVGDTVYCIWQYEDFAKEGTPFIKEDVVESFIYDEGEMKPITKDWAEMDDRWYRLKDILYTKEEAEKALAEREDKE